MYAGEAARAVDVWMAVTMSVALVHLACFDEPHLHDFRCLCTLVRCSLEQLCLRVNGRPQKGPNQAFHVLDGRGNVGCGRGI